MEADEFSFLIINRIQEIVWKKDSVFQREIIVWFIPGVSFTDLVLEDWPIEHIPFQAFGTMDGPEIDGICIPDRRLICKLYFVFVPVLP